MSLDEERQNGGMMMMALEDDDTEVVKKATMPAMTWEDVNYQIKALKALNKMRKNKQFCDVTLRVRHPKNSFEKL